MYKFGCFQPITIVNPDTTTFNCLSDGSGFDYTVFNLIDLSPYGGGLNAVNSDSELIVLFQQLGINIEIIGCEIFIKDDRFPMTDLPTVNLTSDLAITKTIVS